jgi:non-specific serine/threonine protein kinase
MEAAESVSAAGAGRPAPASRPVLDALTSLVDSSLLRAYEGFDGEPRFTMLGTVREFGREQLTASGDEDAVRQRHAEFYLAFAEASVNDLYGGPRQNGALDRLELEHRNIRAALAWAERAHDTETMQRFVGSLFWFWFVRGHATEARSWARQALADVDNVAAPSITRARAMLGAGMLAHAQRDPVEPEQFISASLEMFRQTGDSGGEIFALSELGVFAEDRGDYDRAVEYYETALELYRKTGERSPLNIIMALVYAHLGVAVWGKGDVRRAIAVWEEALERHRRLEDRWGVANVLEYLALAVCEQGDLDRAARLQRESLEMFLDLSSVVDVVDGVYNTATIAGYRGDARVSARLFGAADALNAAFVRAPAYPERLVYDRTREAVTGAIGPEAFTALYRAGGTLSLHQAAQEALAALVPEETPAQREEPRAGHDLTAREIEVLTLLVVGQTDREIADALFISPRTAQGHVGRIYDKLGVNSRSAAVATALGTGIVPAPGSRQNLQR